MAADAAADWAEQQYDEYLDFVKEAIKAVNKLRHGSKKQTTEDAETPLTVVAPA